MPNRILRLRTVLDRTGLSRTTMYRKIGEGTFPQQLRISVHGAGWSEAEVEGWVAAPLRPTAPLSTRADQTAESRQTLPFRRFGNAPESGQAAFQMRRIAVPDAECRDVAVVTADRNAKPGAPNICIMHYPRQPTAKVSLGRFCISPLGRPM